MISILKLKRQNKVLKEKNNKIYKRLLNSYKNRQSELINSELQDKNTVTELRHISKEINFLKYLLR